MPICNEYFHRKKCSQSFHSCVISFLISFAQSYDKIFIIDMDMSTRS